VTGAPVPLPVPRVGRPAGAQPVLLAVAHGTAHRAGIAELEALIARVRALMPGLPVRLAYVDHEPPSVNRALAELASAGAPVAAVPLLLTAAAHSKGDIAGSVRLARSAHPGFRVVYGRPLGADPLVLSALTDRLATVGATASTAVVLTSAGSADPDANAEVWRVARLLWEYRGGGAPVDVAYASATTPTVTEAVERLRRLGHDDVAVAPYFLAPGRLPATVAAAGRAAGARVAAVLGAHDDVARLLLARYAEALGEAVTMNCDTCVYRAPWPGHEGRVGAVQRPHTHPADA
jgi:sirohydrochlorin cobaltochelatase